MKKIICIQYNFKHVKLNDSLYPSIGAIKVLDKSDII